MSGGVLIGSWMGELKCLAEPLTYLRRNLAWFSGKQRLAVSYLRSSPAISVGSFPNLNVRSRYRALEITEETTSRLRRDLNSCAIFPSWADTALWRSLHHSCEACGGIRRATSSNVLKCSRIPGPRYASSRRAHSLYDSVHGLLCAGVLGVVRERSKVSGARLFYSAYCLARSYCSVCARSWRISIVLRGSVALLCRCRRGHKDIIVLRRS
jgi:hypothetical protein